MAEQPIRGWQDYTGNLRFMLTTGGALMVAKIKGEGTCVTMTRNPK
jgi:hypothetical protein